MKYIVLYIVPIHMYGKWECWAPVNRFNHISWVAVFIPTDSPTSVQNHIVIEVFGGVFVFLRDFFDIIGALS